MVSVIVVTYNQEKYISKTLDSILEQECDEPIRIIINDDCSKDGTWDVILRYKDKFPQIISAKQNTQNLGIPNNFFDALKRKEGEYMFFCGGDDWWCDKNKIQEQINIFRMNEDIGLIYTDYKICDEYNAIIKECELKKVTYYDLIRNNTIMAGSISVRSCLYDAFLNDIRPQDKDWKMEDYPLLLWICQNSKLYHYKKMTAVYRILNNSITHVKDINKRLRFENTLYNIRMFYNERKYIINPKTINNIKLANQAHLCLTVGDYESYKIIVKSIEISGFKSLFYKLIGVSSIIFKYACKLVKKT